MAILHRKLMILFVFLLIFYTGFLFLNLSFIYTFDSETSKYSGCKTDCLQTTVEEIRDHSTMTDDSTSRIWNTTEQTVNPTVVAVASTSSANVNEEKRANTEFNMKRNITLLMDQYQRGQKKPNILFLIADDMRPEIGAFYHSHSPWINPNIYTPHLNALASESLVFRRAYCQYPWCNPSRSSLLTSRRPDTTQVHNNSVFFRQVHPHFVTLPQYFKMNGYQTYHIGKVFHVQNKVDAEMIDPISWSESNISYSGADIYKDGKKAWAAVPPEERSIKPLLDELVTQKAVDLLRTLTTDPVLQKKPFFMAVGLKKPHMNWYFPQEFLEKYPIKDVSMPHNRFLPENFPDVAWFSSYEISTKREYINETKAWTKTQPLPDWLIKDLRRAYFSCVSYIDSLIEKILGELKNLKLLNDTIIAFIGDHGFHLGEHNMFGKNTLFEVSNNSPLMIRIPGVTTNGFITDNLVEFVDLFPTLVDLSGLPSLRQCPYGEGSKAHSLCTEGSSLVPLFKNPLTSQWKKGVFYQQSKQGCMGYTIRTKEYRYTEYVYYYYKNKPHRRIDWNRLCGVELYNHLVDPHEKINVADDIEMKAIRAKLSKQLRAGWFNALPSVTH